MNATTPEKPRSEPKREGDGKPRRPAGLDGLCEAMASRYSRSVILRGEMARALNGLAVYPVTAPVDWAERVRATTHVAAVAGSALTPAQKWGIQQMWGEDARVWSQLIGILHHLPASYVNQLATSGYLVDEYVENPDHLPWSQISGLVLRWVMTHGNSNEATMRKNSNGATMRKLIAALEMLQSDADVAVVLGNDAQGTAYVRMQYGGIAG